MPVHDWTKVVAGNFHDFHQDWIIHLKRALNAALPSAYYALVEQVAGGPIPDVLTLERDDERPVDSAVEWSTSSDGGMVALAERPPQVAYTEEPDADSYARRADRIAVYHANGHRVVAYLEIVSPGNKDGRRKVDQFVEKLSKALDAGCHLLVVDVLPPGAFDPRGMHAAIWDYHSGGAHGVSEEKPLGLSAYRSHDIPTAYFEPIAVAQPLPDMPLFLTPEHYIDVPLEDTYRQAWEGVPAYWRNVIEADADT